MNLVVRPEHASLTREAAGSPLSGRLQNIVYFGTDTHYHLRLPAGDSFIVRMQNARDTAAAYSEGEELGIALADNAVQVLRD